MQQTWPFEKRATNEFRLGDGMGREVGSALSHQVAWELCHSMWHATCRFLTKTKNVSHARNFGQVKRTMCQWACVCVRWLGVYNMSSWGHGQRRMLRASGAYWLLLHAPARSRGPKCWDRAEMLPEEPVATDNIKMQGYIYYIGYIYVWAGSIYIYLYVTRLCVYANAWKGQAKKGSK